MATSPTIFVTNAQILTESQVCSIVERMESGCSLHQPVKVSCLNDCVIEVYTVN